MLGVLSNDIVSLSRGVELLGRLNDNWTSSVIFARQGRHATSRTHSATSSGCRILAIIMIKMHKVRHNRASAINDCTAVSIIIITTVYGVGITSRVLVYNYADEHFGVGPPAPTAAECEFEVHADRSCGIA